MTKRCYASSIKEIASIVNPTAGKMDFRSDTVTRPCKKMRDAMANSVLGDDIYGDCPTTNKLQRDVADLFGKEAAILCSSGVQANLIAMMVLAQKKGESIIMGDDSHLMHYERGGMASIGSIMPRALRNNPDGTIDLKDIEFNIPTIEAPHIVPPRAIALETS